jgi:hypothetical protein
MGRKKALDYNNFVPVNRIVDASLTWYIPEGCEQVYEEICDRYDMDYDTESIKGSMYTYFAFIEELRDNGIIVFSQN